MAAKIIILLGVLAWAGCATSSPDGTHSGPVGTRSVIGGVEFWKGGPPPRAYRVLTPTASQGADTSATYRGQEGFIATDARRRGADAVIVLNEIMVVSRMDVITGHQILAPRVSAQLIKYN